MSDFTRDELKDIVRLGVMEGMEAHRREDHAPLWRQIDKINFRMALWGGGLATGAALLRWVFR